MTSRSFAGLVAALVIFLDRLTKIFIIHRYREAESFPVVEGFFHITRVNNTGAAFGILRHSQAVLIAISVFFILVITTWFVQSGPRRLDLASGGWALVLAGAAGNLYDRVRYGYVVDFLDFRIWPVFNLADTSVCIGVFLVLIHFFSKGQ